MSHPDHDAEAAARAACVRAALSHRKRLQGLAGDLEFLRYADSLSDQERRWLTESADRLDRAGGGPAAAEHRLERRFAGLGNSARRSGWLELGAADRATLLRHCPTMRRWVAQDLVELNDFVFAAQGASSIGAVALHIDRLAELEARGWSAELTEPRDLLTVRLGRYAAELNAMPGEQRTLTWDHELDGAARRHLRMLCPWATR